MPATFEEALKAALVSINEDFERADADLHREVAAAAQSLANVTQGKATLTLQKSGESENTVDYALVIKGSNGPETRIAGFNVSSKGYPIRADGHSGSFGCNDKQALADYFSKLASNPDSALVTAAAYIMRKK